MGKKKSSMSLFSTIVQQINEPSGDYHLIDNEYFAAFNTINDIQQFEKKLNENQQDNNDNHHLEGIDMKTFAQEYLVDLPESNLSRTPSQELFTTQQSINWSPKKKDNQKKRKTTTPVKLNNKKSQQNIRQSNEFIFTADNTQQNPPANIFDCLQDEISSFGENITPEPLIIKNEPIESTETKEEPIELNMISTNPMGFGTSEYSGDLDNYVQNIHLLHQSSTNSQTSSRPKRIRKRKKLYIEESESIIRPKKLKTSIRKKRPTSQIPVSLPLTEAEIEQQFGERLPLIKSEHDDEDNQQIINSQVIIEFEPVIHSPQTPIEKARAKLTNALGRGHEPDTYLLKIRSREHKIIEVQLAIYSTTDWYSHRTKILSKIEEALRGLRVSWTKIDIHVDDFDIQISTSTVTPPSSLTHQNSSWFLKILSESNPLTVHIHDRRYPQQRFLIKCSCPECSPTSFQSSIHSSLPVIVNVSPATTPTRRLNPPTILNKTPQKTISSLHKINTTFFNELISQWGRNTVISVTQCVLDLALIISVHTSLPSLCVSPNYSKEEYKNTYQQIIDPLKCTFMSNNTQSIILSKPSPDIIEFYNLIKTNKANIRSAKSMRNLITTSFSSSPNRTLVLSKPSQIDMNLIKQNRRHSSRTYFDNNELKQQAHCTPIIELKPILNGSTTNIQTFTRDNKETRIIRETLNNETTNNARVIRLSITKSTIPLNSTSPPTIRLVPSDCSGNKNESVPLIPKQINIIKPLSTSSSIIPAIKLSNPVLIHNKSQPSSTK